MQPGLVMRQVLVANQAIRRGSVAAPHQFSLVEMALPSGETSYLSDASALTHMELQRDLPAQTALRTYDLKAAQMVRRGQLVMVSSGEGKGFLITLRAEAQQATLLFPLQTCIDGHHHHQHHHAEQYAEHRDHGD
jgi:flagella basal body P-ring formation protein FlgA